MAGFGMDDSLGSEKSQLSINHDSRLGKALVGTRDKLSVL